MEGELVLLSQGPAAGDVLGAVGLTVVAGAHLYAATGQRAEAQGRFRPVYRHVTDCCDRHSGSQDECE